MIKRHRGLLFLLLLSLFFIASSISAQEATPEVTPEAAVEATAQITPDSSLGDSRSYSDVPIFTLDYDGIERSYGLYVPSTYDAGSPAPLLIALHGRFSSAKAFHAISGLAELSEANGTLIAYPETLGVFWNDGGHEALERIESPFDDAGFIGAMVNAIRGEYAVDTTKLFLAGYDSGGQMAYRMACEGIAPFAGVAVVGALLWDYVANACPSADQVDPVPVIIVHGREDTQFPLEGGIAENMTPGVSLLVLPRRLSVEDTINFWRRLDGCEAEPAATEGESVLFTQCETNSRVAYVGVENGGHDWFRTGDDYLLNRHGISATETIASFFFDDSDFALPVETPTDADARSYLVYVPPSYDPAVPMPLVMSLHGRPGTAAGMALLTDLNTVADEHGFIAVYPDGLNNEWNSIGDLMGLAEPTTPQDDVAFLKNLLDDLSVDLNIDQERAYVSGFSNGGFMTMRMACSGADRFAAFAAVGSTFYPFLHDVCLGSEPAPILLMNGSADVVIPFDGVVQPDSSGAMYRMTLSVPGSVEYYVLHNGCGTTSERTDYPELGNSPDTSVHSFEYTGCDDGADVTFYMIVGGGHNWSGVPGIIDEEFGGRVNMDIHAGEEIWAFFEQHTLHETE